MCSELYGMLIATYRFLEAAVSAKLFSLELENHIL